VKKVNIIRNEKIDLFIMLYFYGFDLQK